MVEDFFVWRVFDIYLNILKFYFVFGDEPWNNNKIKKRKEIKFVCGFMILDCSCWNHQRKNEWNERRKKREIISARTEKKTKGNQTTWNKIMKTNQNSRKKYHFFSSMVVFGFVSFFIIFFTNMMIFLGFFPL